MLRKVMQFYREGFREMTLGRTLWIVIAVKLVVMFGILKLFFFPDFLGTRFDNDDDRAEYVLEQISSQTENSHTNQAPNPNEERGLHD